MSSATVICEGVKPCLFVEQRLQKLVMVPLMSGLRQSSPSSDAMDRDEKPADKENGGWSSLQSVVVSKAEEKGVYVHPLDKSGSAKLSKRSLELCTEVLGSESGSSAMERWDEMWLLNTSKKEETRRPREGEMNQSKRCFPPPIRSVRVLKPRREGGRLLLETESVSSTTGSDFQVERSHGRLRLCLLRDSRFDSHEDILKTLASKRGRTSCEAVHPYDI